MASSLGGTLVVIYRFQDTPSDQMNKEPFAISANRDRDAASVLANRGRRPAFCTLWQPQHPHVAARRRRRQRDEGCQEEEDVEVEPAEQSL